MKKEITVVEVNKISDFPPVINLLDNLISNGHKVNFIGTATEDLPQRLLSSELLRITEVRDKRYRRSRFILKRAIDRCLLEKKTVKAVEENMLHSDILWTTSYNSLKTLRGNVLKYVHVLQLMELVDKGYSFRNLIEFPINEYAKKAWKVVVPELNRAYIEKTIWALEKKPVVLPNKPYNLTIETGGNQLTEFHKRMERENRKIVLYLGGIWPDRNLIPIAKAIRSTNDEYVLYIIGNPYGRKAEKQLKDLINCYDAEYLGWFAPPGHLDFVKYAHIGLLSYSTVAGETISSLNALFCAPNKIYEYAAFGIPMIGNDILGLKIPFEQYGIGEVCDENNTDEVIKCLDKIEHSYDTYKENCGVFYKEIDLDYIVEKKILEE